MMIIDFMGRIKFWFVFVLVCAYQVGFAQTKNFSTFEEITNNKVQVYDINSVADVIAKNVFVKDGEKLKSLPKNKLNLSAWDILVNTKTECFNGEKYFRFDVESLGATYYIKIKKQTLPILNCFVNRTYYEDRYNQIAEDYKYYDFESKAYGQPDTTRTNVLYRKYLSVVWLGVDFRENTPENYTFKFKIGDEEPKEIIPSIAEKQIDNVFVTSQDVRRYERKFNTILEKEKEEKLRIKKEAERLVDNTLLLGYISQSQTIPNIDYDSAVVSKVTMEKDSVVAVYYCNDAFDEGFVEGYYKMHRVRIPLDYISFIDEVQFSKIKERGYEGLEERQNLAWDYTCEHTSDEDSFAGMNTAIVLAGSKDNKSSQGGKAKTHTSSSNRYSGVADGTSYSDEEVFGSSSDVVYICTGPYAEKFHSYPSCRGLNRCSGRVVARKYKDIKRIYSPCRICN